MATSKFSDWQKVSEAIFAKEEPKQWFWYCQNNVEVYIGVEHPDKDVIRQKIAFLVDNCPKKLLNPLGCVFVPCGWFKDKADNHLIVGEAFAPMGEIVFYGKDHHLNGAVDISKVTFHHELAHLQNKKTGGVPEEIGEAAWEKACVLDLHHQMENLTSKQNLQCFYQKLNLFNETNYGREFLFASECITAYAEQGDNEDWAESLSFFLHDKAHGCLYKEDKEKLCFAEFWPHRAQILTQYLNF